MIELVKLLESLDKEMSKLAFFSRLPTILAESVGVVDKFKNTTGAEKKKIVIQSIKDTNLLSEFGMDQSVLENKEIKELIDEYIELQVRVVKLKDKIIDLGSRMVMSDGRDQNSGEKKPNKDR